MQSLHVYDYFCYRKWNLEGNFGRYSVRPSARGLLPLSLSVRTHYVIPQGRLARGRG